MAKQLQIRVLIVDDSLIFREVIARGITSDPQIVVVAKAVDPFDARDKLLELEPDVMICDIEMPKMNGIEFVRRLLPQYPLPVIVVSTASDAVFDAIEAGAVEFVAKPDVQSPKSVESFILDLIAKIKVAAKAKVIKPKQLFKDDQTRKEQTKVMNNLATSKYIEDTGIENNNQLDNYNPLSIIAIGASTGGTEALWTIIRELPATIPGIVIVQHIPPIFSRMFAERLNNQTHFHVKEAQAGDYVAPGKILIAPGDKHMRIKKIGDKYKIDVFEGEKVSGHCPSVDVLFESVAKEAGSHAVGIILTGMGYDGSKGLLAMRRKGARTIGQDEQSSVVYGMPKVAYELGAIEKQASLSNIPHQLMKILKETKKV